MVLALPTEEGKSPPLPSPRSNAAEQKKKKTLFSAHQHDWMLAQSEKLRSSANPEKESLFRVPPPGMSTFSVL